MEVRYIEIKTSPEGQIIRAYTPEQYKKEMARRKNATARARKLTRLQERVGAALAMLGFLMLLGAGGMCEIGQIIGYGWERGKSCEVDLLQRAKAHLRQELRHCPLHGG